MKNTIRRTIALLGVTLMATQLIGGTSAVSTPKQGSSSAFEQAMPVTPAQKEVERLLKQISANAAIAGRHAETLESFTRGATRLQFETHAVELTRTKEAVNAMGADFRQLLEFRPAALPWQQLIIDRIEPVLVGLASHTTAAIERLNENRAKAPSAEYRDAVLNLYSSAGAARNLIAVNLDYAQAREKLNRLDAAAMEPLANASPSPGPSTKAARSLEQRVRTALLKLPYYGVFDYLAFQIDGDKLTLSGQVHWPALKADAERAVRDLEGVTTVQSDIEVLPLSPNDDRIRLATYRAIYGQATLARYRLNPHPPIRIIVKHGNVTLMGIVGSHMERTIAHMQANGVPGAFSVTNNLEIGS